MAEFIEKEISPGIFLIKLLTEGGEPNKYIFKVRLERLNILEFVADFTDSINLELENNTIT
jgi:hypothetical protein